MATRAQLTDLDWLRKQPKPYYFGLGWIQMKLNIYQRLHFWCPTIKGTGKYEEDVHDHRYNFESELLYGTMKQDLFTFEKDPEGTHKLFETDCQPLAPGAVVGFTPGNLTLMATMELQAGDKYRIHQDQFHRVTATECVTLLSRGDANKTAARVVKPLAAEHSCPFELQMTQDEIWGHLEAMLEPLRLCNDPDPAMGRTICGELRGHRGDHRTEDRMTGWRNRPRAFKGTDINNHPVYAEK